MGDHVSDPYKHKDREEFFTFASHPDFTNQMEFQLERARRDKDVTFSEDALRGLLNNMNDFVLARMKAQWLKTGIAPQELHIDLNVKFRAKKDIQNNRWPWWQLSDPEAGLVEIDGETRKKVME